jgi:hypothetical protein
MRTFYRLFDFSPQFVPTILDAQIEIDVPKSAFELTVRGDNGILTTERVYLFIHTPDMWWRLVDLNHWDDVITDFTRDRLELAHSLWYEPKQRQSITAYNHVAVSAVEFLTQKRTAFLDMVTESLASAA